MQGNYPKALKILEDALKILNELGLTDSQEIKNVKEGIEIIKSKM